MRAGDHVRVLREGRWDHAIDCGDRTVIHFVGGPSPAVRRSALADFARIGERVEVVPHAERVYPAREVVARAYSRMGDPSFAHMFAGTEQFAVWCKSGLLPAAPAAGPGAPGSAPTKAARRKARPATPRKAKAPRGPARGKLRRPARPAKKAARGARKRR